MANKKPQILLSVVLGLCLEDLEFVAREEPLSEPSTKEAESCFIRRECASAILHLGVAFHYWEDSLSHAIAPDCCGFCFWELAPRKLDDLMCCKEHFCFFSVS